MKFLFVCHDTGNTKVLWDTANALLATENPPEIHFLIIGEAAESIFSLAENQTHKDRVIFLNEWLPETSLKSLTDRKLTDDEIEIVKNKIAEFKPDKAIATSSCFNTALVPYQISELLTEHLTLQDNFIYNGDFLLDLLNNPIWVSLKGEWALQVSVLVAMAKEQELVKNLLKDESKQLTCHVVGSTAIDKIYDAKVTQEKIDDIKQQLSAQNQYLLFISGSKTVADDLELLDSLTFNMEISSGTAVRMGLHPGTKDMQDYVSKVIEWLKTNTDFPAKLMITPQIKTKLTDLSILNAEYICEGDLSGDNLFPAADALASSQPTTLATQAIISGIPTYCLLRFTNSYLPQFFKKSPDELIQDPSKKRLLAKTEMGLLEERAVDVISGFLLGNRM
jgi:hypothetical protein